MCTTFVLRNKDTALLGKNYDFYYGQGIIHNNKRNVIKRSLVFDDKRIFEWTSRYGSITFNQFGRELPQAGMNEKGLAVAQMALPEGKITLTNKKAVNELQWVQYQLDNFSTVKEVLENVQQVAVEPTFSPLHYTVCDAEGNSVLVEFIDDQMKTYPGLPVPVLTNNYYGESIRYCLKFEGKEPPHGTGSLERFTRAYFKVNEFNEKGSKDPVQYAFSVLENVKSVPSFGSLWSYLVKRIPPAYSYWTIVFDCRNKIIYFYSLKHKNTREIRLSSFNYSCKTPVKVFDINAKVSGNIDSLFHDYKREENTRLIEKDFKPVKNKFPREAKSLMINYPGTCRCMEGNGIIKIVPEKAETY
jgi:penicillin V acylase-like amidase (Ntn superfamily)